MKEEYAMKKKNRKWLSFVLSAVLLLGTAVYGSSPVQGSQTAENGQAVSVSQPDEEPQIVVPDMSADGNAGAGQTAADAAAQDTDTMQDAAGDSTAQKDSAEKAPQDPADDQDNSSGRAESDQESASVSGSAQGQTVSTELERQDYDAGTTVAHVRIDSKGMMTWDAYPGATYYSVTGYSWGSVVKTCSCDLYAACQRFQMSNGTYTIKLAALDSNKKTISEVFECTYNYKLDSSRLILSGTVMIGPYTNERVYAGDRLQITQSSGVVKTLLDASSTKIRYQWLRGGNIIGTAPYLNTTNDMVGNVSLKVTAVGYSDEVTSTSVYVNRTQEISGSVSITETKPYLNDTLHAKPGTSGSVSEADSYTPLSYQWQHSTDNSSWYNVTGETNNYYTPKASYYEGRYIRVRITQRGYTGSLYSTPVQIGVKVQSISVTPGSLSLKQGGTAQLKVTVSPSNATDKSIIWSSDNTKVATVTSAGMVTAVSAGNTFITARNTKSGVSTVIDVTVTAVPGKPKQLWRFYSKTNKDHFYTMYDSEKESLISSGSSYKYEGPGWMVLTEPTTDSVTVYRFYNEKDKDHFYTISVAERDQLIAKYKAGKSNYKYEYVGWYTPKKSGVPLYRFYNAVDKDHFYTTSTAEKADLEAKYKAGKTNYKYEGIAWYCAE